MTPTRPRPTIITILTCTSTTFARLGPHWAMAVRARKPHGDINGLYNEHRAPVQLVVYRLRCAVRRNSGARLDCVLAQRWTGAPPVHLQSVAAHALYINESETGVSLNYMGVSSVLSDTIRLHRCKSVPRSSRMKKVSGTSDLQKLITKTKVGDAKEEAIPVEFILIHIT
jgi:hypothetical protein